MDELRRRHPGSRDRVLLLGWLSDRPRHSGANRPGMGERLHRPYRTGPYSVRHFHPVAARANRRPRRLGALEDHGRRHDLSLRLAVALFGHQGIEWDISLTSSEERRSLAEWISLAKSLRPLLHGGELVRMERPGDGGTTLFGLVAQDRSEALFALVRSQTGPQSETLPVRLDGLDPESRSSGEASVPAWRKLPGDGGYPDRIPGHRGRSPWFDSHDRRHTGTRYEPGERSPLLFADRLTRVSGVHEPIAANELIAFRRQRPGTTRSPRPGTLSEMIPPAVFWLESELASRPID